MKVTLLETSARALDILLYTKESRLAGTPEGLEEIAAWPLEEKMKQLDYMRGTIQSSWEFVDYIFSIQGVSRAFTHQLVRTRAASYAQQSHRTVDMEDFEFIWPEALLEDRSMEASVAKVWMTEALDKIQLTYNTIHQKLNRPLQEARAILPTNVSTNIVAKFTLRTLADMAKVRLCYRTQGEYQAVFRAMKARVVEAHPWAEPFIRVHCAAVGTCAFPNFKECPIKGPVFNADTGRRWDSELYAIPNTREEQQKLWESTFFEADPSCR